MPYSPSNIPKTYAGAKLSLSDRRFMEFWVEGHPLHECEKHAGNRSKNKTSLAIMGHRRLKRINIPFDAILEMNGLSDQFLASKVREGFDSNKLLIATFKGKIEDTKEYPDHAVRQKYAELLSKLKGKLKDTHELTGKDGGDLILQVIPPIRPKDKREIDI